MHDASLGGDGMRTILTFVFVLVVTTSAEAQLRYIDQAGGVHWVQSVEQVPPEYRGALTSPALPDVYVNTGADSGTGWLRGTIGSAELDRRMAESRRPNGELERLRNTLGTKEYCQDKAKSVAIVQREAWQMYGKRWDEGPAQELFEQSAPECSQWRMRTP
jgi:hypothetical protein